jgi:ABC-type glycerol-3-phosphate transport system substrate-binding protein
MQTVRRSVCVLYIAFCLLFSACIQNPQSLPSAQHTGVNTLPAATPTLFVQNRDIHGTISIYHAWEEEKRPALDKILREFGKLYPDIYFDVTYIPADELHDLFTSEVSLDRGPTLLFGPVDWGSGFFDAGLIRNVDGLADSQALESLNPAAREAAVYQGQSISLPYSIHGIVLYRNNDLMTIKADSFDELVMLSQAATQGEYLGAILEQSFLYSGGHLLGLGGKIIDSAGLPAFNTPTGVAWLQLLGNFQLVGKTTFYSDEGLQQFKEGKVGWIIDGTWNMVELAEAIGVDKIAIDPWPEDETGRLSGFVQSDNLYLSSSADEAILPAVRVFIDYFLGQQAQSHLVEVNLVPAAQFLDMPQSTYSPVIAQAMAALSGGVVYPPLPVMDLYSRELDLAIQAYLQGRLSASDALTQASDAIQQALAPPTPSPAP